MIGGRRPGRTGDAASVTRTLRRTEPLEETPVETQGYRAHGGEKSKRGAATGRSPRVSPARVPCSMVAYRRIARITRTARVFAVRDDLLDWRAGRAVQFGPVESCRSSRQGRRTRAERERERRCLCRERTRARSPETRASAARSRLPDEPRDADLPFAAAAEPRLTRGKGRWRRSYIDVRLTAVGRSHPRVLTVSPKELLVLELLRRTTNDVGRPEGTVVQ